MRGIILIFFLFLVQTLVFAQSEEGSPQDSQDSARQHALASCQKSDFEFRDWISMINHKKIGEVHIFAIEISNVFSPNPEKKEFWIEFTIGPIPIHAEGSYDSLSGELEICNYAHLPIIGKVKLGCGTATTATISICFDVRLVKGKHEFYINYEEKRLYLKFKDTTAFGEEFDDQVALIPLLVKEGSSTGGGGGEGGEGEGEGGEE